MVEVVVDMTCVVGQRNLPYKANLKSRVVKKLYQGESKADNDQTEL